MIIPIIMAGGSGTRLWPLSRSLYPKQFLSLINENSLLQETLKRLDGLNCLPPVIVSNNEHRFIVAEQLRQFGVDDFQIILEPVGRNTAPAVALAALKSLELHGDHHMLVLAADHAIQDIEAFHAAVLAAEQESVDNKLVTFGIVPTKPETGYGYIKKGEQVKNSVFKVNSFVEKPDLETAKNYLEQKCYLWNSGMFMFKASVYLDELKKFRPDILAACKESLSSASTDLDFIRLNSDVFAECPDESIDYAVMEKTQDCVVIPLDADWSDIGSWTSLWEISEKDEHENVSHGDVINYNSRNNYIYSEGSLISTVGVNNLIIVQTKDALLVAQQDSKPIFLIAGFLCFSMVSYFREGYQIDFMIYIGIVLDSLSSTLGGMQNLFDMQSSGWDQLHPAVVFTQVLPLSGLGFLDDQQIAKDFSIIVLGDVSSGIALSSSGLLESSLLSLNLGVIIYLLYLSGVMLFIKWGLNNQRIIINFVAISMISGFFYAVRGELILPLAFLLKSLPIVLISPLLVKNKIYHGQ